MAVAILTAMIPGAHAQKDDIAVPIDIISKEEIEATEPDGLDDIIRHLPKVIVSASRVPVPANQVGSAVTVVVAEDLEQRQVRHLSDVLRDIPGVAVSGSGPRGLLTQVRIRGAESNHTLVLIDGIEVNNPASSSEFDFASLLNAGIERVEVLRGPQSALYGSDAIGGVINVITKRSAAGDGASAKAEVSAGSYRTVDQLYSVGYGHEFFHFDGTYNKFQTNGVSAADVDAGNTERDGFLTETGRLRAGVTPFDFFEIDFVGTLTNSAVQVDGPDPFTGIFSDIPDSVETLEKYARTSATLTLFDGIWEQVIGASYASVDTFFHDAEISGNFGDLNFSSEGEKVKFDYQSTIKVETDKFGGSEHQLTFLAEREKENQFTGDAFGTSEAELHNNGYAAEYRVGLFDQLFLSASARLDDNDDNQFANQLTHRATAAYLFDATGTRLHASYGNGVKNPTLTELFLSFPGFTPNPNLSPEQSKGFDVGIEQTLFGDRVTVDVTWFVNFISDLIRFTPAFDSIENATGTTRVEGVEVTLSAQPMDGLTLDGSYTFTNGTDPSGARLQRRPRHVASANANYGFEVFGRDASVNLNLRFQGEQRDTTFVTDPMLFVTSTDLVTLNDYLLFNVSGTAELHNGVELFIRGENLLDNNIQDVALTGSPGISGMLGMRLNLKQR
jgi:vitamin B12 transporter